MHETRPDELQGTNNDDAMPGSPLLLLIPHTLKTSQTRMCAACAGALGMFKRHVVPAGMLYSLQQLQKQLLCCGLLDLPTAIQQAGHSQPWHVQPVIILRTS